MGAFSEPLPDESVAKEKNRHGEEQGEGGETAGLSGAAGDSLRPNREFQAGRVAAVATGHAVHDTYTAFLPPLLPKFIAQFGLLKTEAGLLAVMLQIPSLLQPAIGHLSDRHNLRWIVILAPSAAAVLMSSLGIAPSYPILLLLLLFAGINSAGIHAVAPVIAGKLSGSRLGKGMGYWMVGGELGRTIGPVIVVGALGLVGMSGLPILMIGGFLASAILYWNLRDVLVMGTADGPQEHWLKALRKMRTVMIPVAGIITMRAFMATALTTYLPTFLTEEGSRLWFAGISLSVLEAAGIAGAYLGGSLSDLIGRRRILLIAQLVTATLMLIFLNVTGGLRVILLPILGFNLLSLTPVVMALVQENFPENRALANGTYMALSFIIRAAAILLMGALGDFFGLRYAFYLSAGLMIAGLPLIRLLPAAKN